MPPRKKAAAPQQAPRTSQTTVVNNVTGTPSPGGLAVREGEEIWETTTAGRVWVTLMDDRGRDRTISVGGKVGDRLRIKTIDRESAMAMVEDSPFVNGMLLRIDGAAVPEDKSEQALRTEELMVGFEHTGQDFVDFVAGLNEFNVRRMREMAEAVDATGSQVNHLDEVIKTKYRVEGDTESYRTFKQLGDLDRTTV